MGEWNFDIIYEHIFNCDEKPTGGPLEIGNFFVEGVNEMIEGGSGAF